MDENIKNKMAALHEATIKYQSKIHAERNPDKISQIQSEFVTLITGEMQTIIKAGAGVRDIEEIQELLRSALEPIPNSYVPDSAEFSEEDVLDEQDLAEHESLTFLIAVDIELISNFETGQIKEKEFINKLSDTITLIPSDNLEIVDSIVNNYISEKSIFGGEILADSKGDALVVNPLLFKDKFEKCVVICDPAIYQLNDEVKEIHHVLSLISEKDFSKIFNIKKLIKANVFAGYCLKEIKEQEEVVLKSTFEYFKLVCELYKTASENQQCVLIISV